MINVSYLEEAFQGGDEVTKTALKERGLLSKPDALVKILGDGELTKSLTVTADKFSGSARAKIEAAGGTCQLI